MVTEIKFNCHNFKLPFAVGQSLENDGVMIVLLDDPAMKKEDNERSIYALGEDGRIKWQIQKIEPVDPIQGAFWNYLGLDENGNLFATNTGGYRCLIDAQSGRITIIEGGKI